MRYTETYSSVVFVGEGFTPSMFRPERHASIVGQMDMTTSVLTPVVAQMEFSDNGFKVVVAPERFEVAYLREDILPDSLYALANEIVEKIRSMDAPQCRGMGINLNLAIELDEGKTGLAFCRENFLCMDGDISRRLGSDELLANSAKLVIEKDGVRFGVDVEPNFASSGNLLALKLNGHQNINDEEQLSEAFRRFPDIKAYMSELPARLIGD